MASPNPTPPADRAPPVDGVIHRVRTHSEENGWTVLMVDRNGKQETWIGFMPDLREGAPVRATGEWETNTKWGLQFRVQNITINVPSDDNPEGWILWLGGLVKGIGEGTIRKVVTTLGVVEMRAALDANDTDKLASVKGVSLVKAKTLTEEWQKNAVEVTLGVELDKYGVRGALAKKVLKRWGSRAPEIVATRPFLLAIEIDGVGFLTADAIADKAGVAKNSVERMEAGLLHLIEEAQKQGHVFTTRKMLCKLTANLLKLDERLLEEGLDALNERQKIDVEYVAPAKGPHPEDRIYRVNLHEAETLVAQRLAVLLTSPAVLRRSEDDTLGEGYVPETMAPPPEVLAEHAERAIVNFERDMKMTLAPIQKDAVRMIMREKVLVVTGGPGVGKTATVRAMLYALESAGFDIALCAPTGRAAKRINELTGRPAKTIHRLLEYLPKEGCFARRASHPLQETVVIGDEVSMLDGSLAASLLDALDDGARLILVGDVDQLPSVGPGAVLRDIIDSGVVPVVRLTQIFRQAEGSRIITNTHRVNQGLLPEKPTDPQSDFYWIEKPGAEEAVNTTIEIITKRLERRGISTKDCMVLTPQNKGKAGVKSLNQRLQAVLNPMGQALELGTTEETKKVYRVGDRVIQTKNDYDRDVYNGDVGWISEVDPPKPGFTVSMDNRPIAYEKQHFPNVSLAYAITTHKFQGSQSKAVIVIMLKEHFNMLSRQWIYTSLSRGEKLVILIADLSAVQMAIRETKREVRRTTLRSRIVVAVEAERARRSRHTFDARDRAALIANAPDEVFDAYENDPRIEEDLPW